MDNLVLRNQKLIEENTLLKQRIGELEQAIADHKKAEKTLQLDGERSQLALASSKQGWFDLDIPSGKVTVSPEYSRIIGYDPEEFQSSFQSWVDALHPEDRDIVLKVFQDCLSTGDARSMEYRRRAKSGEWIWICSTGQVVEWDSHHKPLRMSGTHTDITERKLMEQALEVSRERYQSLFEQAGDGIFILDAAGKIIAVNQSFALMHGYSVEEILSRGIERLDVEGSAPVPGRMQRILNGETLKFEVEHYHKDGHTFPLSVTANLVSAGGERLIIANHRDLTEQKRAKRALQHSHDLMRYIIEHNRSAVAVHDRDLKYIYVSQRYLDDYNVKERDVIGKHHYDVFPDLPQKWRDVHQKALAGVISSAEDDPYEREDGSVEWTRWECRPWYEADGSIGGIIVYTEVITERKRIEKELRETKERYDYTTRVGKVGTWDWNVPTGHLVWNDETFRLLGLKPNSVLPSFELFLELVHPDDRAFLDSSVKASWYEKKPYSLDCQIVQQSGKEITCHITGKVEYGADGRPIRMLGTIQDITERKKADEHKRNLEERLNRAEKMEALGQLAGGVAHDLNNVLGILTGYSELLLGEVPEGSQTRVYINKILQSTGKGAAIIQDLLMLARRGVNASEVVNLNNIGKAYFQSPVLEKVKDQYPRITFRTEYDADLPNIKGSPVHLEKTLMNLVLNAAEAVSGEGEVTVRTESRYLDRPFHAYEEIKEGDYAVLIISDTGMGISVEDREKIFEPFYTKKKMGRSGTGLGLAIVWGTIRDHNGYVDVQTEEGKGTTFTLYFPVTQEELLAQQEKIPVEQYMGNGESVLVVDDIEEQREIASRLLTKLGYKVHLVSSGEEAVAYLQSGKTDILVLDMIMEPGIDGLETYRRIISSNPQQKAIMVSGFSETDRTNEAQKLGVGAYVKKPYVLEKIGLALRDELARK